VARTRKSAADDDGLLPLELVAIAHLGKKAETVRDVLDIGDGQPVNFKLHLFGGVNVGSPTSYKTPAKPDLVDVIALALMGSTRAVSELTDRLAKAYRRLGPEDSPTIDENLRKQAKEIIVSLSREREVHQRGRVSAALQYELLGRE